MSDQLRGIFIAGLGEMHLIPDPERGSFLAIPCVQVIRGVDELSGWESRFSSPSPTLLSWLELLFPDSAQRHDSGESFQPVRCTWSIQCIKQGPSIHPYLIGVLLAFFLLAFSKRSCSTRSP